MESGYASEIFNNRIILALRFFPFPSERASNEQKPWEL
jgi:hypothetical protein